MSYFGTVYSPEFDAATLGLTQGKTTIPVHILGSRKSGWVNTSTFGDACEYLDTSQSLMNVPTSGQTLYIVSDSASDTSAGTGARTVRVVYLDSSGNQQVVTKTMNGTTPVSMGTGFSAIQWAEVATLGSSSTSVGNISISSTNGVATVATTFEYISAGGNRSLSGRYVVPTGYKAFCPYWGASAISTTMDIRLRADCFADDKTLCAGVFHFKSRLYLAASAVYSETLPYLQFPAGGTVKVSAIPGSAPAGNRLDCDFTLLLQAV